MSDTRIDYKNKGFWIAEGFVVVLSKYLCDAFEKKDISSYPDHLKKIYLDCDGNRGGGRIGNVEILFDGIITEESDKIDLFNVFEEAKRILLSKGSELSVEILNGIEDAKIHNDLKTYWSLPIKTQSLVATLEIIEHLLNDTISFTNGYGLWYVGFPKPEGQPEI